MTPQTAISQMRDTLNHAAPEVAWWQKIDRVDRFALLALAGFERGIMTEKESNEWDDFTPAEKWALKDEARKMRARLCVFQGYSNA